MSFLPSGFTPPPGLRRERFQLRPITVHDVVKDFDAVMSSRGHLWGLFGDSWGWPPADMTLEQDLVDLAWHQKEAELRRSFNFAVMSPDEARLLGCVYVDPAEEPDHDAEVTWWARADELAGGLEEELGAAVREWIAAEWPFERVRWGR